MLWNADADDGGGSALEVDSFDDGDLSEYTGDTGAATVQSTTAYSESALQVDTTGSDNPDIFSASGLPNYPSAGDVYEVRHRHSTSGVRGRLLWGMQAEGFGSGSYRLILDGVDGELVLQSTDSSGSLLNTDTVAASIPTGEWLRVEVDWRNSTSDTVTATVYDASGTELGAPSIVDTTWDSGGIGWTVYGTSSGSVYFDEAQIL